MKFRYRTVFLSDIHLGSRGSRAKELSRFLKRMKCERLYLVGDIIDMQLLRRRWHWPTEHNTVVRRLLKIAKRKKCEVLFIPGNHDDGARQFHGLEFGGVRCVPQATHITADGRKLLVVHGDQFDLVVTHKPLLSAFGGMAYEWLIWFNRHYNAARRLLGMSYLSLSQIVKLKVKSACKYISRFEETLIEAAERAKVDGVVCGHIHKAEVRTHDETGITYYNCGDWVESCTILVEHFDGRMEILDGLALLETLKANGKAAPEHEDADLDEPEDDETDADDEVETSEVEEDEQAPLMPWLDAASRRGGARIKAGVKSGSKSGAKAGAFPSSH